MKSTAPAPYVAGLLVVLALLAACGDSARAPSAPRREPLPGPTPLAPSAAPVRPEERSATPTPVPPLEREVVLSFASASLTLGGDWDKFHADFDAWREGLADCDASSLNASLRGFAARFVTISEAARKLPRDSIVRGLAHKAIAAAQQEEDAIRGLRDNWRPGDATVFEAVETERAAASALQKEVEDGLADHQSRTSTSSRELLDRFALALRSLDSDWDAFHRRYDLFRADEGKLDSVETVGRLSALVGEFRDIVGGIRELPSSDLTRPVAQLLAQAAEGEDLALRKLRGTFEKQDGSPAGGQSAGTGSSAGSAAESGTSAQAQQAASQPEGETSTTIFVMRDPTLFDAFDAQLVQSNALRRQALEELGHASAGTSEENLRAVESFKGQHDGLIQEWDGFHAEYDDWRRTEGGCDRPAAIATLGEFALRFGALAQSVRGLPRATFLRPMDEALRDLRNTWRPFDSEVYNRLDQERNEARRLRRQVTAGVQDLLPRYAISVQELEQ